MSLKLKTAPATEPVTSTEAKLFLRVDASTEDALITIIIEAARNMVENYTKRALITQTWNLWLDHFPYGRSEKWWEGTVQASRTTLNEASRAIIIPRPNLVSVTSVTTYDDADAATVFSSSNYITDIYSQPGRIILKNGQTWPAALRPARAIDVEFVCGYGAASAVPAAIKHAMLLIIGKLYECRGEDEGMDLPKAARVLLEPYRVLNIADMNPQRSSL